MQSMILDPLCGTVQIGSIIRGATPSFQQDLAAALGMNSLY